ncbi:hypothetical protein SPFM14_00258 [Salmonella phage SPFM14]|nr:hypothetical protein SPFM14_00258 [Salmonella phage SPFM14]
MLGGLGSGLGSGLLGSSNNLLGGSTQGTIKELSLGEALRGNAVTKDNALAPKIQEALRENNGHLPNDPVNYFRAKKAQQASSANSFTKPVVALASQQAPQENLDLNTDQATDTTATDFRIGRTPAGDNMSVYDNVIQTLPYNTGPRRGLRDHTPLRPLEEEWIGQLYFGSLARGWAQYVTNYNQVVLLTAVFGWYPSVTGSNDPRPTATFFGVKLQRKQDKVIIFNIKYIRVANYKHMFEEESLDGEDKKTKITSIFISSDMTIEGDKKLVQSWHAVKNYVYGLLEAAYKKFLSDVVCADLKDPTISFELIDAILETAAEGKNIRLGESGTIRFLKKAINANLFLKEDDEGSECHAFHPLCESVLAYNKVKRRLVLPTAAMIKRGFGYGFEGDMLTIDDGHPAMFTD